MTTTTGSNPFVCPEQNTKYMYGTYSTSSSIFYHKKRSFHQRDAKNCILRNVEKCEDLQTLPSGSPFIFLSFYHICLHTFLCVHLSFAFLFCHLSFCSRGVNPFSSSQLQFLHVHDPIFWIHSFLAIYLCNSHLLSFYYPSQSSMYYPSQSSMY